MCRISAGSSYTRCFFLCALRCDSVCDSSTRALSYIWLSPVGLRSIIRIAFAVDELLTGLTPFETESENPMETYEKIMKGDYVVYAELAQARDLIAGLLYVLDCLTSCHSSSVISSLA